MKLNLTWRLWILIVVVAFSLISIFVTPNGIAFTQSGVVITSIDLNSTYVIYSKNSRNFGAVIS